MKEFHIKFKKEALQNEHIAKFIGEEIDSRFEVLGSIGDKLLITKSGGDLIEVYPRFCKRVF